MKYIPVVLIALLMFLALSCGSESSDSVQESEVKAASEPDTALVETEIESVNATDEDIFLLGNGRAGLFEVGMSAEIIAEIAQAYGDVVLEEVDLMLEGMHAPAITITFPQETSESLVLELDSENATVYRIKVYSDRFITDRGTGTASTLGDLQANYQFEGVFWGESGNPFVIIEELNSSVILVPGEWWNIGVLEEDIPPDTKISSFLIL